MWIRHGAQPLQRLLGAEFLQVLGNLLFMLAEAGNIQRWVRACTPHLLCLDEGRVLALVVALVLHYIENTSSKKTA